MRPDHGRLRDQAAIFSLVASLRALCERERSGREIILSLDDPGRFFYLDYSPSRVVAFCLQEPIPYFFIFL